MNTPINPEIALRAVAICKAAADRDEVTFGPLAAAVPPEEFTETILAMGHLVAATLEATGTGKRAYFRNLERGMRKAIDKHNASITASE